MDPTRPPQDPPQAPPTSRAFMGRALPSSHIGGPNYGAGPALPPYWGAQLWGGPYPPPILGGLWAGPAGSAHLAALQWVAAGAGVVCPLPTPATGGAGRGQAAPVLEAAHCRAARWADPAGPAYKPPNMGGG
jgi:hypothetical protein